MNMEEILSMKSALKQEEILDPVLSANMDFAAREIMYMEPALSSGASLFVSGESALVKFFPDKNQSRIHFTVISKDGQPQLIRHVTCDGVINGSDIKDVHFSGHACQDRVKSCLQQAQGILESHNRLSVLHILCNSLSLTYSCNVGAPAGQNEANQQRANEANQQMPNQQNAVTSYTIKTQCRFSFQGYINVQRLLDVRSWLEQEKPQKKGLTACIDHLLKQVFKTKFVCIYGGIILQSDGEMVELSVSGSDDEYFITGCPTNVCMIAENSQK